MQTKRTIPEFNPLKVPMHLPAIYTSTNFDNNHVVSAPTKTKAQTKRTNRGVKISTIIEPKKLNAAMENKKGELYASATSNDKVQLYIKANWDNAITSDKHNTCMTDEIKVNTRKKGEKYEVYHLDESSIQLGLNMESEFPSLK